jgi:hypothetical protein
MSTQLESVVAHFERMQARLHRLTDSMPDDRFSKRADPGRWSVAECVAHLNLTGRAYVPMIRASIAEAKTIGGKSGRRYRRDTMGWLISTMAGPMPRVGNLRFGRVKTAAKFVPGGELDRQRVMSEFDALQADQIALAREADGLPIDRVQVVSPFVDSVKYNLYSALVLLPRHQERHVWQAENVWANRG